MSARRRVAAALAALIVLALAPAAARAARTVPHEVVVGLEPPAGASVAAKRAAPPRFEILHVANVAQAIRALRHRPGVAYAVPNVVAHLAGFQLPNDRGWSRRAGGWLLAQWNFAGPFGVNAPQAWQHLYDLGHPGGEGVTVAVLDTGVAYRNWRQFRRDPDLAGTRFVPGYDFVARNRFPLDRNGHGTFVTSTIAETTGNGIGLTGLAYGARIMPVRVLDANGYGDAGAIGAGIRWAVDHGAKIINLSLEFSSDVTASQIPQILDAVGYAYRKGVLVVGAAGNEAHGSVAYPARSRYVMAVGATTQHGCLSDFSNDGPGLDVVAPGGGADADIPGDPNCHPFRQPGLDIYQMTFVGGSVRRFGLPSGYEGTSMAVPHVAAAAALVVASHLLGADPTPTAIEARLEQTARDLGAPGYDIRYGYGLLDAGAATDPAIPAAR